MTDIYFTDLQSTTVKSYFSFASSTICSASEKLRTWSLLGRGWTAIDHTTVVSIK